MRRLIVQKSQDDTHVSHDNHGGVSVSVGKNENGVVVESQEIKKALKELHKKDRVVDLRKKALERARALVLEKQGLERKYVEKPIKKKKSEKIYPEPIQETHQKSEPLLEKPITKGFAEPNEFTTVVENVHADELRDLGVVSGLYFWKWPRAAQKSIAIFTVLSLVFSFSVRSLASVTDSAFETKDSVVGNAELAYDYIKSASGSLGDKDYSMAEYKFGVAAERFFASKQEIDSMANGVDSILSIIPGGTQINAAENLLEAGGNFAIAGEYISKALEPFKDSDDVFQALKENKDDQERAAERNPDEQSLTDALEISKVNLEFAMVKIDAAQASLEKVNTEKLPADIKDKVQFLKDKVPQVSHSFKYFLSYADILLTILGHDSFKRYLVLFQNNTELRAGGGFIGTYAKVDVSEGKVTHMLVEGPYNIDGQLKEKIKAPEALHLINNRFYMRDSNWFADFPTSARKAASLYEKSGGPTVDGVISMNASVVEDLLKLTGPVDMPDYEVTVTHENFFKETQREVEISYDKELNKPKKFVSDLMPRVLEKMLSLEQDKWIDGLLLFTRMFEEKEVMIYFNNPETQSAVYDMGWAGEVKHTEKDYLNIVNSNIGGGKTDRVIEQKANIETEIQSDGSIINTVTLSKEHHGDTNDFWTRVKNVSYTRFYVPKGSDLLEAKGFDADFYKMLVEEDPDAHPDPDLAASEGNARIDDASKTRVYTEGDKTVFGNFIGVETGMTKVVQIKYRLPFKVKLTPTKPVSHYSMLFQKQSGAEPIKVEYIVSYPLMYLATWQYLTDSMPERKFRRLESDFLLDKDKTLAVVFSQ